MRFTLGMPGDPSHFPRTSKQLRRILDTSVGTLLPPADCPPKKEGLTAYGTYCTIVTSTNSTDFHLTRPRLHSLDYLTDFQPYDHLLVKRDPGLTSGSDFGCINNDLYLLSYTTLLLTYGV
jgi:hypothetical protein